MQPFTRLMSMKTLLIDDDEYVRDSLRLFFESKKCCLRAVETAEEGLEVLSEESFDIVITDYMLPGMDGLEFCKRLRKINPRALTILITAYGSAAVTSRAVTIGIHELIEKPFTTTMIEDSLSRLVEKFL